MLSWVYWLLAVAINLKTASKQKSTFSDAIIFCSTDISFLFWCDLWSHGSANQLMEPTAIKQGYYLWCNVTVCPLLLSVYKQRRYDPARPDSTSAQPGRFHGYTRYLSTHLSVCLSMGSSPVWTLLTYLDLLLKFSSSFNCIVLSNIVNLSVALWYTCAWLVCRKIYLIAGGKHLNWIKSEFRSELLELSSHIRCSESWVFCEFNVSDKPQVQTSSFRFPQSDPLQKLSKWSNAFLLNPEIFFIAYLMDIVFLDN